MEELLDAGIDVLTTVNVQHLESLNDVVGGVTGVRVRETVPDHVFDEAAEVVLVDLPPDDLRRRLHEGKVYIPGQAERAIEHFFRKGNLIALRELALRRTADRVDDQMREFRDTRARKCGTPATAFCCASATTAATKAGAHRRPAGGAARLPLACGLCGNPKLHRLPENQRRAILRALRLAQELGAETATWPIRPKSARCCATPASITSAKSSSAAAANSAGSCAAASPIASADWARISIW